MDLTHFEERSGLLVAFSLVSRPVSVRRTIAQDLSPEQMEESEKQLSQYVKSLEGRRAVRVTLAPVELEWFSRGKRSSKSLPNLSDRFRTGDLMRVSLRFGKPLAHGSILMVTKFSTRVHRMTPPPKRSRRKNCFESGKERRYAWDYDTSFDLFEVVPGTEITDSSPTQLAMMQKRVTAPMAPRLCSRPIAAYSQPHWGELKKCLKWIQPT